MEYYGVGLSRFAIFGKLAYNVGVNGKMQKSKADLYRIAEKRGYRIVGEYEGNQISIDMICPRGHPCKPQPNSFKGGKGCIKCARNCPKEAEKELHLLAEEEGYMIIGDYVNNHTPIDMICPEGHKCKPQPYAFKSGKRCFYCSGNCPEQAQKELHLLAEERGYTIIGNYTNTNTTIKMICPEGHECNPTPKRFKQGRGCLHCSKTGFDPAKSAIFYYLKLTSHCTNHIGYKVGITNNNIRERYQGENPYIEDYIEIETDGFTAQKMESKVKKDNRDQLFDTDVEFFNDIKNTEVFKTDVLNMF